MGQEAEGCWICGAPANSAEHRLKRSDGRATFGSVSQHEPLYLHTDFKQNARLNSLNASVLKFQDRLCEACNTKRTQPYDRAWEKFSNALRRDEASILAAGGIDLRSLYGESSDTNLVHLQLFFVKLTLGQIVASGSKIDRQPFRNALLNAEAMTSLFLKLCILETDDEPSFAGQSDVQEWRNPDTGDPIGLAWAYLPGSRIELQILWFGEGKEFIGAWRPGLDSSWVPVHSFRP